MKISRKHGQTGLFVVRGRRNDIIWDRTNNTTLFLFKSIGSLFKTDRFTLQEDCWTCLMQVWWSSFHKSDPILQAFSIWDLCPQRRGGKSPKSKFSLAQFLDQTLSSSLDIYSIIFDVLLYIIIYHIIYMIKNALLPPVVLQSTFWTSTLVSLLHFFQL